MFFFLSGHSKWLVLVKRFRLKRDLELFVFLLFFFSIPEFKMQSDSGLWTNRGPWIMDGMKLLWHSKSDKRIFVAMIQVTNDGVWDYFNVVRFLSAFVCLLFRFFFSLFSVFIHRLQTWNYPDKRLHSAHCSINSNDIDADGWTKGQFEKRWWHCSDLSNALFRFFCAVFTISLIFPFKYPESIH